MTDAHWTLWVFAGPGALSGPTFGSEPLLLDSPVGEPIPLSDVLARLLGDQGKLPAGVKLVAETVGEPTVLQQLTGEWPTQRLVGEPGQTLEVVASSPAERDLGRFLAWAEEQTPKDSKRALIVLGDLLQAIGEAPKALPIGGYRPGFPTMIKIRKGKVSDTFIQVWTFLYGLDGQGKTLTQVKSDLSAGNFVQFDAAFPGSNSYWWKVPASGDSYGAYDASFNPVTQDRNPVTATITWADDGVTLGQNSKATPGTITTTNRSVSVTYDGKQPWDSPRTYFVTQKLTDTLGFPSGEEVQFDSSIDPNGYWWKKPASGNSYGAYDSTDSPITSSGNQVTATITWDDANGVSLSPNATATSTANATRSVDDVGPAPIDLTTRRVDALARALAGCRVDLLASDECDLVHIVALRQLASNTGVFVGPQGSRACAGQPLVAMLEALSATPDVQPEALATALTEAYAVRTDKLLDASNRSQDASDIVSSATRALMAPGHALVALRRSRAMPLVAALDVLASEVLAAGEGSSLMRDASKVLREGGDIARLIDALGTRGRTLEADVTATIVVRRAIAADSTAGKSFGIDLDGLGLQPGSVSDWTRLLDQVGGNPNVDLARRTLEDMQALTRPMRCASANEPSTPLRWLEYNPAPKVDFEPAADFEAFLADALAQSHCRAARHLALVVRGTRPPAQPASVALAAGGSLAIVKLARCLHEQLSKQGRGPLAMIVFDDPELLGLEIAYELRNVADTLMTSVAGMHPPTFAWLEDRVSERIVRRCERDALEDALRSPWAGSTATLMDPWRREVARRLAKEIVAPDHEGDGIYDAQDPKGAVALQGIDLRHMQSLCRRFDRILQLMVENLGEPAVLGAVEVAWNARSLIELINRAQMDALYSSPSPIAREIYYSLGDVYNWISVSKWSKKQGGAPFWLDPRFVEDRNPDGYCSRLRIELAPNQPKDYRQLSFHRDVRLHALLTSARLLDDAGSQRLWGLISLGLHYAPNGERRRQLEKLGQDLNTEHYFKYLGTPPLLSLDLEGDGSEQGYELRLSSSESAAVLLRQHSVVDLGSVEGSLEGLGYVLSQSATSRDGWIYLDSLGANLAEDVISDMREQLERERDVMRTRGHSREAHLALALPRELMRFPWEMMRLASCEAGRTSKLLAEQFAIGRQMWSHRELRRVSRDHRVRMLIVADVRSDQPELPGAREEGLAIQSLCAAMNDELGRGFTFECDAAIGRILTRAALRKLVREGNYDVLHFAGHAYFNANQAERSGWVLSDGMLSVPELRNTLAWTERPPWLIYANACSAGMIDDKPASLYQGDVHGMAEACIHAGVNAVVAPLWRLHDVSAQLLATEFYRELLLARSTIGVALHHARIHVRKTWESMRGDTGLGDVSWAGMVLFGNPTERLNESAS